jgi:hypothetical protein
MMTCVGRTQRLRLWSWTQHLQALMSNPEKWRIGDEVRPLLADTCPIDAAGREREPWIVLATLPSPLLYSN